MSLPAYADYLITVSISSEKKRSALKNPLTFGQSLTNFVTYNAIRTHPSFVITKARHELTVITGIGKNC